MIKYMGMQFILVHNMPVLADSGTLSEHVQCPDATLNQDRLRSLDNFRKNPKGILLKPQFKTSTFIF
jgi:hypothetical protein